MTIRTVRHRDGTLELAIVDAPTPGAGQLLVAPLAVGICGSDVSAIRHTDEFLQASRDSGMTTYQFDPHRGVMLGHEFTAEIVEVGPDVDAFQPGERIVAIPAVSAGEGAMHTVGYSSHHPGGLSTRVVLDALPHPRLPDGVSPLEAALTEPLTTGTAAVGRASFDAHAGAVVIGCGTVGLGAVAALAERDLGGAIVASDPSPHRRRLALAFGADLAVDPTTDDPFRAWQDAGGGTEPPVVFEASGSPGMLDRLLHTAPAFTHLYALGSVMTTDAFRPVVGIYKNISITFCSGPGRGQSYPDEMQATLDRIADGRIDARRLITGCTGLPGAVGLLDDMAGGRLGDDHLKVLVLPDLDSSAISDPWAP